jgi:hypothetical protein
MNLKASFTTEKIESLIKEKTPYISKKDLQETVKYISDIDIEEVVNFFLRSSLASNTVATPSLDLDSITENLKNYDANTLYELAKTAHELAQSFFKYMKDRIPNKDELITTSALKGILEGFIVPDYLLNNPNPATKTFVRDIVKAFSTLASYYFGHEIGSTGVKYDFYSVVSAILKPILKVSFILTATSIGAMEFADASRTSNIIFEVPAALLRSMTKLKQKTKSQEDDWDFFVNNLSWEMVFLSVPSALVKQLVADRISYLYGGLTQVVSGEQDKVRQTQPPIMFLFNTILPAVGTNLLANKIRGIPGTVLQEIINTIVIATFARMAADFIDQAKHVETDTALILELETFSIAMKSIKSGITKNLKNQENMIAASLNIAEDHKNYNKILKSHTSTNNKYVLTEALRLSAVAVDWCLTGYTAYSLGVELKDAIYEQNSLKANDKFIDFGVGVGYFASLKIVNAHLNIPLAVYIGLLAAEITIGDYIYQSLKCNTIGKLIYTESCHSEIPVINSKLQELYCALGQNMDTFKVAGDIFIASASEKDNSMGYIIAHCIEQFEPAQCPAISGEIIAEVI